ncbi:VWA domain-containing protein [Leekyejoonella antrihumi]|uniref:VWA domain-containing protein n=1 Tax=Leekyejoonella antrihumi TaxID=1660198 RepID=A0A563DTZ0_9MICO|nr:VWA domain-containing protein [Leekyejoonella antrihumi]TWP33715.1 VWA domain-containing protein [Leekyejoonella antrihumi]
MIRVLSRASALLVATLTALALTVGGAWATTTEPQKPTLSEVSISHGTLHGILTVPGAASADNIDPGSLEVQYGSGAPRLAKVTPITQERRTALILIDTSGSMAGSKLVAAKSAAKSFLAQMPPDVYVGLASFSGQPHLLVSPTRKHASVTAALTGLTAGGETGLYDAIQMGIKDLGTAGSRTIVLLSDGGDTVSKSSLTTVTSALRGKDVRISAIGFQTDESQYGVLGKLATAGEGTMTRATDSASLQKAFASAARRIAAQVRVAVAVPANVGGSQPITVTGIVNGKRFTANTRVLLPPSVVAAPRVAPSAASPVTQMAPAVGSISRRVIWIAAAAVFVGLLTLILLGSSSVFTPHARKRIRTIDSYVGTAIGTAKDTSARRSVDLTGGLLRVGDAFARRRASSTEVSLLLERADLPIRVNEWYVLRALSVTVGVLMGWLLIHGSAVAALFGLVLGGVLGFALPPLLLKTLARRRARLFRMQLPDVLTLLASSLATGFSLPQAIDGITKDAAEPSGKEFARALAETRIGAELEDALDRMATRMESVDMTWTVMAIRIQRHVGGNLSETLRTTARTLRDRESLRRQIRALSADGRLSSYFLVAMPFGIVGYLWFVNRSYISLLWTNPFGIAMMIAGATAMAIGIIWMRRVVVVEV